MEGGEGMVAVVRGLRDSGLAVTLLDGSKQYTLMPNASEKLSQRPGTYVRVMRDVASQQNNATDIPEPIRCDSASQATDGRYASMYKTDHCKISPTSPPVHLTEFPPQRVELCRGRDNFEVGGCGSGESKAPSRSNGSIRGQMSWPGSSCFSPRSSREPDAFANSLRKYPNFFIERSAEMVERLITYTQAKNYAKSNQFRCPSPSRQGIDSNSSSQVMSDRSPSRGPPKNVAHQKGYGPDSNIAKSRRIDESPTRDVTSRTGYGEWGYDNIRGGPKSVDARYYKEISKKSRSISACPYTQPSCPFENDQYDYQSFRNRILPNDTAMSPKSVSIEVQVSTETAAKQVATVPRATPPKKTVAVPLSPTTSTENQKHEVPPLLTQGKTSLHRDNVLFESFKGELLQILYSANFKAVQTSLSSVNMGDKEKCCWCNRKIKSQDDLGNIDFLQNNLLEFVTDDERKDTVKVWNKKILRLAHTLTKPGGEDKIREKIHRYLESMSSSLTDGDEDQLQFREQLPDSIVRKLKKIYLESNKKRHNAPIKIMRLETPTQSRKRFKRNDLRTVVKTWLNDISLEKFDFLGRLVNRDNVLDYLVKQIESCIQNGNLNFDNDNYKTTIHLIIRYILDEIPIENKGSDKMNYLSILAMSLVDELIKNKVTVFSANKIFARSNNMDKFISEFISQQLASILEDFSISSSTKKIHLIKEKILYILANVTKIKDVWLDKDVRHKIRHILLKLDGISEYKAKFFTDIILKEFKDLFYINKNTLKVMESAKRAPTYSTCPMGTSSTSNWNVMRAVERNHSSDSNILIEQIKQQITRWFESSFKEMPCVDQRILDEAFYNFAEDIYDRIQYLQFSPLPSHTDENELQYLKYQIYKWFNKIVGDTNLQVVEQASKLMLRIKNIDIPKKEFKTINKATSSRNSEDSELYFKGSLLCSSRQKIHSEIMKWFWELTDFPKGVNINHLADKLTCKIVKNVDSNEDVVEIINSEVNDWIKIVYKGECQNVVLEKLKQSLRKIILKPDAVLEKHLRLQNFVKQYEHIIRSWVNKCLFGNEYTVLYGEKCQDIIHITAIRLYNSKYMSKLTSDNEILNNMVQVITVLLVKLSVIIGKDIQCTVGDMIKLAKVIQNCKPMEEKTVKKEEHSLNNILKDWLKTLLWYRNASAQDQKRFEETVESLAPNLTPNDNESYQNILKFVQIVFAPIDDDDIIAQHANSLQSFLQKNNYCEPSSFENNSLIDHKFKNPHVAVYGLTLASKSKEQAKNSTEDTITPITDTDIRANLDLYAKELVNEIYRWLNDLQIAHLHDKGCKEIVVNDLADDIIDRLKYLEFNPASKGSDENEVEQLKYQIFKWINKLVGEEHQETIQHAPELMDRIRRIPVPMLVVNIKSTNTSASSNIASNKWSSSLSNQKINRISIGPSYNKSKFNPKNSGTNVKPSSSQALKPGPTKNKKKESKVTQDKRQRDSTGHGISDTPMPNLSFLLDDLDKIPKGMSLSETYQYFDKVFKDKLQELPLETPTAEQEHLVKLARTGIYNGIWKTYFALKADPEAENNYTTFEVLFDQRLNDILDCLPQTAEMQNIKQEWKRSVLTSVVTMLKYEHAMDSESYREKIINKLNRSNVIDTNDAGAKEIKHCFVWKTADAYILYSKYKEEDSTKANIYRQRLMKRLEELSEEQKCIFHSVNNAQLCKLAFQILESVPLPGKEALKEEADEILMAEEIEDWYKALPVKPIRNENDDMLRRRLREILAKKLCTIEKQTAALGDPTLTNVDVNMKHEISRYLEHDANLRHVNDLNINYMVEELANRVRNRREQNMLGYEEFERESPISSTFVQTEPAEVMAPLVDIQPNIDREGYLQTYPGSSNEEPYSNLRLQSRAPSLPTPNQTQFSNVRRFSLPLTGNGQGSTQPQERRQKDQVFYPNVSKPANTHIPIIITEASIQTPPENFVTHAPNQMNVQNQYVPHSGLNQAQSLSPTVGFTANCSPTRSTARVGTYTDLPPSRNDLAGEDIDEHNEDSYKCHCMERVWRCERRHHCERMRPYPRRYFPMPYPRYFR